MALRKAKQKETPMNMEKFWQAVVEKDNRFDNQFVYAVRTTGIYCRPSCPSRKPKPENVLFFPLPEIARQAGFRPCQRCRPDKTAGAAPAVEVARRICRYIESHLDDRLSLSRLSKEFELSPSHLQRTFKRIVGLTPHEYTEACRMTAIKTDLRNGENILTALFDSGYQSTSRLYQKATGQLGMTPRRYQRQGEGLQIIYTIVDCPLGKLLVAATSLGICSIKIGDDEEALRRELLTEFRKAEITEAPETLSHSIQSILNYLEGKQPNVQLPLDVQATAFQRRVWKALQEIPYGTTRSYSEIAEGIGEPQAVRAVANACAANPTALIVPCHRVVRKSGDIGGYRWGVTRKKKLLEMEKAGRQSLQTKGKKNTIHTD